MTTSTSVHSNAFNFMSFLQSGVDPRTGQYTVSISLPDVKTNDLRGPGVPLMLTYNPLNTEDSGFGQGWDLKLTQYTLSNLVLSLGTGEAFKVTDEVGGQLMMKEKKLDSFHFYKDSDSRFRVVHKSGLVEILEVRGSALNRVALPVEIHSPEGHKVTLDYQPFNSTHQLLSTIKDDSGQILLSVTREAAFIEILLLPFSGPGDTPVARFVMSLEGATRRVNRISLPTDNLASWRFGYGLVNDHLCMTSVETPTGGREDMFYLDGGHQFPAGSGRGPLPRITRHLTKPGFGQPEVEVRYTYPQDKNFLGFGLTLSWADDGLDNLYKHIGAYEYVSVEALYVDGQPARTTERKFNQFHLLTSETTTQKNAVQTAETTYFLTPDAPFEAQPNYCQLPKEARTSWSLVNNPNSRRTEIESQTYDSFGNQLTQTQANGVIETSTWYPAATDPEGFVRHLKDQTVTPAPSADGPAPTLRTKYQYKALPPLQGSPLKNWLTVESQTLVQVVGTNETELERTVFEYTVKPEDPFLHGRVNRQTVIMNGNATITDYGYSKLDGPDFEESVLQTVETLTGFNHEPNGKNEQKQVTLQHSLLNGEPLLQHDDNDVEIRYAYDALRRVISETVAPDTEWAAAREYQYFLCANAGEQAEQWLFDVKQVKTCTKFDGLNRAICEERADADNTSRANESRQTYAGKYDELGNLIEETEYDWLGEQALALVTQYEYDDWGAQRCVISPDGVKTFEEVDPIGTTESNGPIQRSWREGAAPNPKVSGETVTWFNLFEKPTRTERLDLSKQRVSLHQYFYDGLGRTKKEIVGFGDVQRETGYDYDNFDRLTANTLPDRSVVKRTFAPHSREDLPTSISVNDIPLGTQVFDGLDRRTHATTGGREQVFDYAPGQTQPKTVTTPSGEVIEYVYQPQLGTEPTRRRLPRLDAIGEFAEAIYEYDKKNARLVFCEEQGIQLTREYFSTGEPKSETRSVEGIPYTMDYRSSRLGRLLGYTDVLRQEQTYRYDVKGRMEYTQLGTTASTFTYDSLGRTATILTRDSAGAQSVGITLQYDEFDREILRSFDLNGVKQELAQVYNDVDNLIQRTLKEGAVVLRDETYGYDLRGRLVDYDCNGTQPPIDPYNKAIIRQVFRFNEIDNLTLVTTVFTGGTNQAIYTYDTTDPAQLRMVRNLHADYPTSIELEYNADGHLIRDEEQRTLAYDPLGRLISVSALPGETPGSYSYDPLDTLAGMNDGGGQEHRFYQGDKLASQIKGANSSTFMRGDDAVLAEHQAGADPKSLMLASDDKSSVLGEVSKTGRKSMAYAAYGHRAQDATVSGHLGYNGERREGQTGWYLLGNGYRAFSPVLMRFHSPDSWSPFKEGGVNAYTYVEGNPVGNVDPTGHSLFSIGGMLKFVGVVAKTGRTAAHKTARTMAGQQVWSSVDDAMANMKPKNLYTAPGQSAKITPAKGGHIKSEVIKGNYEIDYSESLKSARKAVAENNQFLLKVNLGSIKSTPSVVQEVIAWKRNTVRAVASNKAALQEISSMKIPRNSKVQELQNSLNTRFERFKTPGFIAEQLRQSK